MSFKGGVATFAALLALLGSAQLAHAGIGDVVDDPASVAENALPSPEATELDDVVEEATETVDAVVADPTGAVENVVEQAKTTVESATGTVKDIADKTLVTDETLGGKAMGGVAKEPAFASAGPSPASPARSETSRSEASGNAPTIKASKPAQDSTAAAPGPTFERGRPGSNASSATAQIDRSGTTRAQQVGWTPPITQIPASTPVKPEPVNVSSAAPAVPSAPPPPGDQPATAASVAGATGAALLAALFSALFFLALQTGRLARPGPILARAEPCLSLPERPG